MTIKCATWDACSNSQIIIDSYHNKYNCVIYSDTWYCSTEVIRPRVPTTPTPNPTPNPTKRPSIYPSKHPLKQSSIYPTISTAYPSKNPSIYPSIYPSVYPSKNPSEYPTESEPSTLIIKSSIIPSYLPWIVCVVVLICIVTFCVFGAVLIHSKKLNKLGKERSIVHIVVNSKSNNIPSLKSVPSEPNSPVIVYNLPRQITTDTMNDHSIAKVLQLNQFDRKKRTSGKFITKGEFEFEYEHQNEGVVNDAITKDVIKKDDIQKDVIKKDVIKKDDITEAAPMNDDVSIETKL